MTEPEEIQKIEATKSETISRTEPYRRTKTEICSCGGPCPVCCFVVYLCIGIPTILMCPWGERICDCVSKCCCCCCCCFSIDGSENDCLLTVYYHHMFVN